MKRNRLFIVLALFAVGTTFSAFEILEPGGAPPAKTGSPGDMGANCTECHGGSPTVVMNWITSNIPMSGYVPGTTYQITATNNHTATGKYGFQVTAEKPDGTKTGVLSAGSNNHLVGNGKYATHNTANTTVKTWVFNWTAPAAGTGVVIFYGAFAKGNPGPVALSQLAVVESNVGVGEINALSSISIGPNPSHGQFTISNLASSVSEIHIFDMQGKEIYQNIDPETSAGSLQVELGDVKKGIYFLDVISNDIKTTKKLIVN